MMTPVVMATNRSYSKTKIGCSRHCYITHNFFLAPTSFTHPEVFWKQ